MCQARGHDAGWLQWALALVIFGHMSTLVNDASVAAGTKRGFCFVMEIKLEWMHGGGAAKERKAAWHDPYHVLLTTASIHCLIK